MARREKRAQKFARTEVTGQVLAKGRPIATLTRNPGEKRAAPRITRGPRSVHTMLEDAPAAPVIPALASQRIDRKTRRAMVRARASTFKPNAEVTLTTHALIDAGKALAKTVLVKRTPLELAGAWAFYALEDWVAGTPGVILYEGNVLVRWPGLPKGPDGAFPGTLEIRDLAPVSGPREPPGPPPEAPAAPPAAVPPSSSAPT